MHTIDWQKRAQKFIPNITNFIEGRCLNIPNGHSIDKYSPRDGRLLYELPIGTQKEIEQAVSSARRAFRDKRWRGIPLHERQDVLNKFADLIDTHRETFGLYESLDAGKPISQALGEVPMASGLIREAVNSAERLFSPYVSDLAYCTYNLRNPVGVVGAIIPWNYPLMIAALKIGPALIMGNSLILKPSEYTSLSAGFLAVLAVEAGIPPGVLNIVNGAGPTVGASLALHPDVDLLSFTGSSGTGKQMQIAAGQSNMKRLLLECGGKSPYIVFDDCPTDLDMLADDIIGRAFQNQSQNCMAGSRLLMQQGIKEKLLAKILDKIKHHVPKDILDPSTIFGAMIHEAHLNKVLAYINSGKKEGATLIHGGNRVNVETGMSSEGFYVEPTIFDDVTPCQKIAREEIFGPILSILTFNSEQEAVDLANNSPFGLAAYVATENIGRVERLSKEINAGSIMFLATSEPVNCMRELGREGRGESGYGVEGGMLGLASYSVNTSVHKWT